MSRLLLVALLLSGCHQTTSNVAADAGTAIGALPVELLPPSEGLSNDLQPPEALPATLAPPTDL